MACTLTEYAHFLCGVAAGVGGLSYRHIVAEVDNEASAICLLSSLPALRISRIDIDDNLAEDKVRAHFGPQVPACAVASEHPVVRAIRNSKAAGVYR